MRRRRQSAGPRNQMAKAGPYDPYCGFRSDRERRQALRNREVCSVAKAALAAVAFTVLALAGQPVQAAFTGLLRLLP